MGAPAHAAPTLAGRTGGVVVDLGVGVGGRDLPFAFAVTSGLGLGGWWGRYDREGALGRHVAVLVNVRSDFAAERAYGVQHHLMPTLEVRRGVDLLVIGYRVGGQVGPWLGLPLTRAEVVTGGEPPRDGPIGLTARAMGMLVWRARPPLGVYLRVDAGVDVDLRAGTPNPVQPALGVLVGFEAVPWIRKAPR